MYFWLSFEALSISFLIRFGPTFEEKKRKEKELAQIRRKLGP